MTLPNTAAYDDLMAFQRTTEALGQVSGRLGWDQETVMPRGSAPQRAEEMGALEEVLTDQPAQTIRLGQIEVDTDGGDFTAQVIEAEVEALNQDFKLPVPLTVSILPCGEPNAYYDPQAREITMCTEFADNLAAWAPE